MINMHFSTIFTAYSAIQPVTHSLNPLCGGKSTSKGAPYADWSLLGAESVVVLCCLQVYFNMHVTYLQHLCQRLCQHGCLVLEAQSAVQLCDDP